MPHTMHEMTDAMRQCSRECLDCYAQCLETVQHCLMMGGKHAGQQHIALMLTCARICETSASAMLLGTTQHVETCRACAAICHSCEEECRRMAGGDETMLRCAEACARCAESCDRMARAA